MKSLNINSKTISINESIALSHLNFLTSVWETTPIYLVDPILMDYLYPPEKLMDYDYEMLKNNLFPENMEKEYLDRDIPQERSEEKTIETREYPNKEKIDQEMNRVEDL